MRGVGTVNYSSLQLSDRLTAACEAQNKPRPCILLYCTRSNTSDGTPSVTPLLKGVPNHTECAAFRLLIYIGAKLQNQSSSKSQFPRSESQTGHISQNKPYVWAFYYSIVFTSLQNGGGTCPPISKIPQPMKIGTLNATFKTPIMSNCE